MSYLDDKEKSRPSKKGRPRKYTDAQVFALWQEGKTDAEIGADVGVSRAMIQKWRDDMELPSNKEEHLESSSYTLEETPYGIYAVCDDHCTLGIKNRTCSAPGYDCMSCGWYKKERDRRERIVQQKQLKTDENGVKYLQIEKSSR